MKTMKFWLIKLFFIVILVAFPCMPTTLADAQSTLESDQCPALFVGQIAASAHSAPISTQLQLKSSVLPGGSVISIDIPAVIPDRSYYCARFVENNEPIKVVSAVTTGGRKTTLTIEVPDPGLGVQQQICSERHSSYLDEGEDYSDICSQVY